jgi:diketogulonate reductase-like aldo/keto reductase
MFHGNMLIGPQRGVTLKLPLRNGLEVPALGFGTYRIPANATAAAVEFALKCGFRHIDCAKIYHNEQAVGEGIRQAMTKHRIRREDLFITSKLWPTDQAPEHVRAACVKSIRDIGVGYLDLYLVHWPVAWQHTGKWESTEDYFPRNELGNANVNGNVTLRQTWDAMEGLVGDKLVRSLGVANCAADELMQLAGVTHCPVTNQVECHPGLQQHLLRAAMHRDGVVMSCYCPLGMPTRFTPPDFAGVAKSVYFSRVAELTGFSPQRLLINWSLDNCNVVLVKSQDPKHIADNAKASTGMLSDAQRKLIQGFETIHGSTRVINPKDFRQDGLPFFK